MFFGGEAGKVEMLCHTQPGSGDLGKWPGKTISFWSKTILF
jgi:hypothetical protein